MFVRLFPLAFLLLAALAPLASAAGPTDLTPGNRWVDATYTLTQPDIRTIELAGDLLFYEYDLEGSRYTADDMGEAYINANTFTRGPYRGNELVTKIEEQARASFESTLAAAFPTATRTIEKVEVDRSTLVVTGGNEYDPGVRIVIEATIVRTNEDIGLGSYGEDAIEAVFKAGALVSSSFSLSAQSGYNSVYRVGAPASPADLVFASPSGEGATLSADGKTLIVSIDNAVGTTTLSRAVTVDVKHATATAPSAEDVRTNVEIALGAITQGSTTIPVATQVEAELRAVNLEQRFPGILPEKVSLEFLSADAIRALRAAGAITDENLAKADKALLDSIEEDLETALGTDVTVAGQLSRADIARPAAATYASEPPIGFSANAAGSYILEGAGAENLDLALRVGGRIEFDLNLFAAKDQTSTFTLRAPDGLKFASADKGTLSADEESVIVEVPPAGDGERAYPVVLSLVDDTAPVYTEEKAELSVVVDLKDLDITIGGALGGDMGDLVIDVTVTGSLGVLAVPEDMKDSFDSRLALEYLSSDALRLLRERGVLSDENLTKIEAKLMEEVRKNLASALGAQVDVTGGFDMDSFAPSLVSEPLSGDKPVLFKAQASFRKPLAGEPAPQAAIALYTQTQSFTLPKVQGRDTLYTIILPKGLAVTDVQATGGESETGKSDDGRDQFTVRPTSDEAQATVSMAVTPGFVMAKFWPIVLLAVMIIVLLVGTPVALVMRSRSKKKAAAGKK